MGAQPLEFEAFAACLRALKERAGLSYGALAAQTRISSSSLHRYCSGAYVPQDYGPAHRFAKACGASPTELRRLHRLWALADAARGGQADGEDAGEGVAQGVDGDTGQGVDAGAGQDGASEGGPASASAPASAAAPVPAPSSGPAPAPGATAPPAPLPDRSAPPAPGPDPVALAPVTSSSPSSTPRPPWHRRRSPVLVVVLAVLALGAGAWGLTAGTGAAGDGDRPLFSAVCEGPVAMGQRGVCVQEAQRLLAKAGADIGVDGQFGPETLRRVTAFQVLSRIPVTGTVGEETKKALYAPEIRMDTWSPQKVRQRIREVFPEAPDLAVAIADCQSFLDPLHVLPNTDGSRNWGVFQISDATLRGLDGTPLDALDPEWNIQAAHRLWSRARNFHDWPNCERAASPQTAEPSLVPTPT